MLANSYFTCTNIYYSLLRVRLAGPPPACNMFSTELWSNTSGWRVTGPARPHSLAQGSRED